MDAKEMARLDQLGAIVADTLPSFWWRLYCKCQESGFTKREAMTLVQTYIFAQLADDDDADDD